jgi:hypothetical protein
MYKPIWSGMVDWPQFVIDSDWSVMPDVLRKFTVLTNNERVSLRWSERKFFKNKELARYCKWHKKCYSLKKLDLRHELKENESWDRT